ncbi:MAG: transposase [Lachnospiraceae bacterium]|nr:transposase [Bacilli bacterium]MCI9005873.1 transposase [Lachnospiraceae bacterium]
MTDELFNRIIERLIDDADAKKDPDDKFADGINFAYSLALDTIRNHLIAEEYNLEEYGLEEDPIKKYM